MNKIILLCLPLLLFAAASMPSKKPTRNFNSGFEAQNAGNFEEAIQYYKKAIEEKPDNADAWNNMGYCFRMVAKANLNESGDAYAKALAIDPSHKQALEYQGEYFVMVGQLMSAYRNYEALQKIDSDEAAKVQAKLNAVLLEAQAVLKNYKP